MATTFERELKKSQNALALLRKAAVKAAQRDGVQFSVWTPASGFGQPNAFLSSSTGYASVVVEASKTRRQRSTVK